MRMLIRFRSFVFCSVPTDSSSMRSACTRCWVHLSPLLIACVRVRLESVSCVVVMNHSPFPYLSLHLAVPASIACHLPLPHNGTPHFDVSHSRLCHASLSFSMFLFLLSCLFSFVPMFVYMLPCTAVGISYVLPIFLCLSSGCILVSCCVLHLVSV